MTAYGLGQPVGHRRRPEMAPGPAVPVVGATPQQGVDYSGTNVQEPGVDEPDLVKTNGVTLFAVENGSSRRSTSAGHGRTCSTRCKLDGGWSHELLLYGKRLLVLSRGGYWVRAAPRCARGDDRVPQPSSRR